MLTKNAFGVDLGTSVVKIYSLRKNRLLSEHDMIAVMGGSQVIAVGNDAYEMYEKEGNKIDSTNVSTPDHTHAGYVLDALGRGLNVYGQKPLCHDISQCRQIERLAAEKQAVTQMGTQIAAWECDRQTAAYLKSGVIGTVQHVWIFSNRGGQTTSDHTWPLPEAPVPPRFAPATQYQ